MRLKFQIFKSRPSSERPKQPPVAADFSISKAPIINAIEGNNKLKKDDI